MVGVLGFAGCATNQTGTENNNVDSKADITVKYDKSDMFTDRDLEQTIHAAKAERITLESNKDVIIKDEGTYIITGEVNNASVIIKADDDAKVQIGLEKRKNIK
ncbi:MAG: carbohydrate-binding domain-containing protein [Caldisericia bacterium]